MRLKSKAGMRISIPILSFITIFMLSGCNGDVFIDRPEKPDIIISNTSVGAGEYTTITADFDVQAYPMMTLRYTSDKSGEYTIYDGKAQSFEDDLIQLSIDIDAANKSLKMTVDHNYYPGDVYAKFYILDISASAVIQINKQWESEFRLGEISYELNHWETRPYGLMRISSDSFYNDIDETLYYPIIWKGMEHDQQGKFKPDNPITDELIPYDFHLVPVPAFNYKGSPVMTDTEAIYGPASDPKGFTIPGYPLVADETKREKVAPGQTLTFDIYVETAVRVIRYSLPLVNNQGTRITINGDLLIAVPTEFKYTHSITK